MTIQQTKSFERVFPRRNLFKSQALRSLIWSGLGSVLLCLLLFDLFLIADLIQGKGELKLPTEKGLRLNELIGEPSTEVVDRQRWEYEDSGLIGSVWWSRNSYWGPLIASAYRNIRWLQSNSNALILLVASAVLIGFLRSVLMSRARGLSVRVALDATTKLRRTLHRQALRLGPGALRESETIYVLTLFTDEVDRVQKGVQLWISRLGRYPFEILLLLIMAISVHLLMAIQCLFPLALCWYLLGREKKRHESVQHRQKARTEAELRLLAESFRKTRIVRGFGMENFEHDQFRKHLDQFRDKLLSERPRERWSRWVCLVVVTVCVAIVLYLVGSKVLRAPDDLSLPAAVLLLGAFAFMYRPLDALANLRGDRENATLAADRIYRYLNRVPEVSQAVGAKFLQPLSKSLKFESISYSLPNKRKILEGFDLNISAGSVVAIVSLDPLEARSVAYLLPRFIEPQSGRILIDGEDIAWVTLESLLAEIIYVGGSEPFFTGTVFENISCGSSRYSLQDVTEASKKAHAHNFILKLPQGYETVLGEHGEQLDAGQGFRLGLARAVLRNPALMLIEEPNASLDGATKSLLDDAYNRILRGRTVLFFPSRLSTLRRADQVVLIRNGKVVAIGKYSDLVRKSQLYRHWEYVRFNEFNVASDSPS